MLTPAETASYHADGLVIPKFRFDDSVQQHLSQLAQATLEQTTGQRPESINCPYLENWTEGLTPDICQRWLEIAGHPEIVSRVKSILGKNIILWGGQFFCKPATDGLEVPWHQDGDYWPIKPLNTCTVWLAIDDADSGNGCMRYIPGSHKAKTIFPSSVDDREDLALNQVTHADAFDVSTARDDELQSGEFSLHDVYLVHGSAPNRSARRRAALVLRFMSADSLYDRSTQLGSGTAHYNTRFPVRPIYLVSGDAGNNNDDFLRRHPVLGSR